MRYRKTENTMSLLGGALLGAAAMYLLDPEMGRKRRAHIKGQAGEYLDTAGGALHSGWDKLTDRAQDVGQAVAGKAQKYGEQLSDLAASYGERLRGHAEDLTGHARGTAKAARASLADTLDDWRSRGSGYADDITDYGHQLWKQVRGLGKKLRARGEDAADEARAMAGHQHASPVLPVTLTAVGCCALGVGLMYLMDPQRGRQRRAWLSDTIGGWARNTGQTFYRTGKDVANRAYGESGGDRAERAPRGPLYSEQLRDRVQSEIGRVSPGTQMIQVMCDANGSVTLTGSVRPEDSDRVIAAVEDVDGVNLVINRLELRSSPSASGQSVPQM